MKRAALGAFCALLVSTGCDSDQTRSAGTTSSSVPATVSARAELPELTRGLIPPEGRGSMAPDELKVDTCGISPTFPCTNAFFTFAKGTSSAARLETLRTFASEQGWR